MTNIIKNIRLNYKKFYHDNNLTVIKVTGSDNKKVSPRAAN